MKLFEEAQILNESNYGHVVLKGDKPVTDGDPAWEATVKAYNNHFENSFIQGYYGSIEWGGNYPESENINYLKRLLKKNGLTLSNKLARGY